MRGAVERMITRGVAECVISSRDRKPSSMMPLAYKRERWFVARYNQFIVTLSLSARSSKAFVVSSSLLTDATNFY